MVEDTSDVDGLSRRTILNSVVAGGLSAGSLSSVPGARGAASVESPPPGGYWPSENHGPGATNSVPAQQAPNPNTLDVDWKVEAGGESHLAPIVGPVGLFAVSRRPDIVISCLNTNTGRLLWKRSYDGVTAAPPVLVDGRVHVGPSKSGLSSVDNETGQAAAEIELIDSRYRMGALSKQGSNLFYLDESGRLGNVDTQTNEVKWQTELSDPQYPAAIAVQSDTAFVATRELYAGPGAQTGWLHAIDTTDGSVVWTKETSAGPASVTVTEDIVVVGTKHEVTALNTADGATQWSVGTKTIPEQFALRNSNLVFGGYRRLVAVDVVSGEVLWQDEFNSRDVSPVIAGETVFAIGGGSEETAYEARIAAYDLPTGNQLRSIRMGNRQLNGPAIAAASLFVSTESGTVYSFN